MPHPDPARRALLVQGGAYAAAMLAAPLLGACAAPSPSASAEAAAALAPGGRLRACINLGNPILATRRSPADEPTGVSVDLARRLAQQLGAPLELVVVDAAGQSVQAVRDGRADVGFFAIDPGRSDGIRFTAAYVLIEGAFLVRQASPLTSNDEVDRAGTRVMVGQSSVYDLYLSRSLKAAQIERAPTSPQVVDTFLARGADVAAGVKQQLQADAARLGGLRLLPGRFMRIDQAMGLPAGRGDAPLQRLAAFVEDAKASGFVADALRRHGIAGASVAPAA